MTAIDCENFYGEPTLVPVIGITFTNNENFRITDSTDIENLELNILSMEKRIRSEIINK